jgi:hypothetical protein
MSTVESGVRIATADGRWFVHFWVLSPADCSRYSREPGADDELESPPEATGAAVRRLQS